MFANYAPPSDQDDPTPPVKQPTKKPTTPPACPELTPPPPGTLNRSQLAQMLGITPDTVSQLLAEGQIPHPLIHRPRLMLWSRARIERWLAGEEA